MRKIAIFVEGQTELITIREFILRKYCSIVSFECFDLFGKGTLKPAEYNYKSPDADVYYRIINIGNDQKVLSAILERESSLFKQGFEKIIGVRDMYSKEYRDFADKIDIDLNNKIINFTNKKIEKSVNHEKIFLCFSIMEIEAWFLALYRVLTNINENLTAPKINEHLKFDLTVIDPETHFFHPAAILNNIYNLEDLQYDKHKGDIEAICKHVNIEDYEELNISTKCNSFKSFFSHF